MPLLFLLNLEEPIGYPAHTGLTSLSVCLFVCLSVHLEYKKTQILNVGIRIRLSTWSFSVCCPSPLDTYSYVQEENLGSTRKFVEIYSLFTCITNLILATHMQSVNGLEEPF